MVAGGAIAERPRTRTRREVPAGRSVQRTRKSRTTIVERTTDPFGFRADWHETRRRTLIMSALTRAEYRYCLRMTEGALLPELNGRVRSVLALEGLEAARGVADGRTRGLPWVSRPEAPPPYHWPRGSCDLAVLSGVGSGLSPADLTRVVDRLADALELGGELLALHRREAGPDQVGGDEVHARLRASPRLESVGRWVEPDFRLEILTRV